MAARKKPAAASLPHKHLCACGEEWDCNISASKCLAAIRTNGQPPVCSLCHHLIMAARIARGRDLPTLTNNLRGSWPLNLHPSDRL